MPAEASVVWLPQEPDPRSDGYPLIDSFWPTALITLAYVVGVYVWLKVAALNKKRTLTNGHASNGDAVASKPVTKAASFGGIKCLMVVYNISMVFYSVFIVIEIIRLSWLSNYGLGCIEFDRQDNEIQRRFIRVGYLFYLSKFLELFDTLFFLLRGKFDQVTFLHVFHHSAMPPSIWWGLKYAPVGIVHMFPLANSFVHIIMYTYYGLAALGLYRYLWWKKYLTLLQMIQFLIFIVHQGQVLMPFNWDCRTPKIFPLAIVIYAVIFLVLFGNFYQQAYRRKRRLAKRIDESNESAISNGRLAKRIDESNESAISNGRLAKRIDESNESAISNGKVLDHVKAE